MISSKIDRRVVLRLINIFLAFITSIVLATQPCMSQSIHERIEMDNSIRAKVASWQDSLNRLNPRNRPVYRGLDISLGTPMYRVESNINALNNLPVNYFGGMAGGVLANPIGKIKAGIGMYYSGGNVPYTFDLLTAKLSVNLYLLRIKEVRYHTWEPYIFGGISQMKNKFYGHYLPGSLTKNNVITSEQPYIGSVLSTHLLAGTGVEYQLESDGGDFIHLYAEISVGANARTSATTNELSGSTIPRSIWITVGISPGKFR